MEQPGGHVQLDLYSSKTIITMEKNMSISKATSPLERETDLENHNQLNRLAEILRQTNV